MLFWGAKCAVIITAATDIRYNIPPPPPPPGSHPPRRPPALRNLWVLIWLQLQELQFPLPRWLVPDPRPNSHHVSFPCPQGLDRQGAFGLIAADNMWKDICWAGSKDKALSLCQASQKVVFSWESWVYLGGVNPRSAPGEKPGWG